MTRVSWTNRIDILTPPAPFGGGGGGGGPTWTTLLSSNMDSLTTANPISLSNFRSAMGDDDVSATPNLTRTSINVVSGADKCLSQNFDAGTAADSQGLVAFPNDLYAGLQITRARISYDIRWLGSSNGVFGWGGKIPGLGGTRTASNPPTGGVGPTNNGWSGRMMFMTTSSGVSNGLPRNLSLYMYHPDQPTNYGEDFHFDVDVQNSTWYRLGAEYQLNTVTGGVGNLDGVLKGWFDTPAGFDWADTPQVNETTFRYRNLSDLYITTHMHHIFYGGATDAWVPTVATNIQIDNLLIEAVL